MLRIKMAPVALLVVFVGCNKDVQPTSSTPSPEVVTQATVEAASSEPAPVPVIVDTANLPDPKAAIAASNAALKSRQYEEAAKALLIAQERKLTDQQSQAMYQQMIQLQRSVAEGVANGDPKAMAAAELLRAAHSHH